nr:MAG TPA: hypothetical protein [Caudoviricetes sp.]
MVFTTNGKEHAYMCTRLAVPPLRSSTARLGHGASCPPHVPAGIFEQCHRSHGQLPP